VILAEKGNALVRFTHPMVTCQGACGEGVRVRNGNLKLFGVTLLFRYFAIRNSLSPKNIANEELLSSQCPSRILFQGCLLIPHLAPLRFLISPAVPKSIPRQ
jgi:hypothetical protein